MRRDVARVVVDPARDRVRGAACDVAALGRADLAVRDVEEQLAAGVGVGRAGAVRELLDDLGARLVLDRRAVRRHQRDLAAQDDLLVRIVAAVALLDGRRLTMLKPRSAAEVREAPRPVVGFSPAMEKADREIKGFLYPRMYRHDRVMRVMADAERVVRDLFAHYKAMPVDLPDEWGEGIGATDQASRARRIGDYIAGMTDRYALVEHAKYFKETPELR